MSAAKALVGKIVDAIVNPLILLLVAIAFIVFLWGLAQFIMNAGDVAGRSEGKKHMIWGLIGLFIMIGVLGIINILAGTVGFTVLTP